MRTIYGDVAAFLRLNVFHWFYLLTEGPAGRFEGHQLIILTRKACQVILQFLEREGKKGGKKGHLKRAALSGVFLPQHGPGGVRTICVTVSLSRRNLCIFSIPDYFTNKLYCARVFLTQISNIYKYNNLITVLLISAKPVILWRRYQVLSMLYLSQPLCFLVFFSKSHQKEVVSHQSLYKLIML